MEEPVIFTSDENSLVGIVHVPPTLVTTTGVVIVVGGPQTRVGSHRQFVLLARALCQAGIAVFRYDQHGMGDSEGEPGTFLDGCPDLQAAIDTFRHKVPALEGVALWGLCDAASQILMYLSVAKAPAVSRLFLLNPWVRQSQSEARVYLGSYYWRRLKDPQFWKKLGGLRFDWRTSLRDFFLTVGKALRHRKNRGSEETANRADWQGFTEANYLDAMYKGLASFSGECYLILSGNDLTADEFRLLARDDSAWSRLLAQKVTQTLTVAHANHTFSSAAWRAEVEAFCLAKMSTNNAK